MIFLKFLCLLKGLVIMENIKYTLTLEEYLASFQDVNLVYKPLYATWMIAKGV